MTIDVTEPYLLSFDEANASLCSNDFAVTYSYSYTHCIVAENYPYVNSNICQSAPIWSHFIKKNPNILTIQSVLMQNSV